MLGYINFGKILRRARKGLKPHDFSLCEYTTISVSIAIARWLNFVNGNFDYPMLGVLSYIVTYYIYKGREGCSGDAAPTMECIS